MAKPSTPASRLSTLVKTRHLRYALILFAFAILGLLALRLGGAATFVSSSEAENGTTAGIASRVNSNDTSGGQSIAFGISTPAPSNVKAITGGNSIALIWDMPKKFVKEVEVYRNNTKVATVTPGTGVLRADILGTRYIDKAVSRSTAYQYRVRYITSDNRVSPFSSTVQATHPAANATTPVPTVTIDTALAPDLANYLNTYAKPEIETWYPKISDAIAYPDYLPGNTVRLFMDPSTPYQASASGNTITVRPADLRNDLADGGGMFLHEAAHLIQAYPSGADPTGWIVEGIADWVRDWFTRERSYIPPTNAQLAPYSPGGLTVQWAESKYSPGFIHKLNVALHRKTYTSSFIPNLTGGKTDTQLFAEAKQSFYGATGPITGIGGKCLDIQDSSSTIGAKLQLLTCNNSNGQKWTPLYFDSSLRGNGKSTIYLVNYAVTPAGHCVDVYAFATNDGATASPWTCNREMNQEWAKGGNGSLMSTFSSKCLAPAGGSSADGTQIVIASCNGSTAQRWTVPN